MSLEEDFKGFLKEYRDDREKDMEFKGELKQFVKVTEARLNNQGERVRALEQFRNWGAGAIAAVGAIIGWKAKGD